jgi:hypothetical protein
MSEHQPTSLPDTAVERLSQERREAVSWRRILAEGALLLALLLTSSWLTRG